MLERNTIPNLPKNVIRTAATGIQIDPLFTQAIVTGTGTSWTVYAGTSSGLVGSVAVPLAWSRGLSNTGTWPAADGTATGSCWGPEGGHIVYGDGHVSWCTDTTVGGQNYFTDSAGAQTPNWAQSRGVPATAQALQQQ